MHELTGLTVSRVFSIARKLEYISILHKLWGARTHHPLKRKLKDYDIGLIMEHDLYRENVTMLQDRRIEWGISLYEGFSRNSHARQLGR